MKQILASSSNREENETSEETSENWENSDSLAVNVMQKAESPGAETTDSLWFVANKGNL